MAMETCEEQKNRSATTLTSKIIAELIKNILSFMGARIAAINLFQVDLDKS